MRPRPRRQNDEHHPGLGDDVVDGHPGAVRCDVRRLVVHLLELAGAGGLRRRSRLAKGTSPGEYWVAALHGVTASCRCVRPQERID